MKKFSIDRKNPIHVLCGALFLFLVLLCFLLYFFQMNREQGTVNKKAGSTKVQVLLDADYNAENELFGVNEKEVCTSIVKELGSRLESKGIRVKYTQTSTNSQSFMQIYERRGMVNVFHPTFFLSIRTPFVAKNSGVKCYGYIKDADTLNFAKQIDQEIQMLVDWQRRGIYDADIFEQEILQDVKVSALVIEAGWLGNSDDRQKITDVAKRKEFVSSLANGIEKALLTSKANS